MIDNMMFSSTESWNEIPLISILLPYWSFWFNSWSFSVYAALCLIALNHNRNHGLADASNDAFSGVRKMILQFWTTSILDRIHNSLRSSRTYHKKSAELGTVNQIHDQSSVCLSNRVVALWHSQSAKLYKTIYVWINVLFFVILCCNFFGLVPLCEAITSKTGFTIGLSFAVWTTVTFCGIQCLSTKFVRLFLPSGLPFLMAPIFVLLEFVSYSFRALSLGIRLWANMIAGHQLIHLVCAMTLVPALCITVIFGAPITVLATALLIALTGLEFIVCILQSGVFCLLASFYLNEALHTHNPIYTK